MLSVTNRYRAEHNATALIWNNSLADSSLQWAKQCHWKHSVRWILSLDLSLSLPSLLCLSKSLKIKSGKKGKKKKSQNILTNLPCRKAHPVKISPWASQT
jgi:hypothetical protein